MGKVAIDKAEIGIIFAAMTGESRWLLERKRVRAGIAASKRAYFARREGNRQRGKVCK
jgi:hypothetical protein